MVDNSVFKELKSLKKHTIFATTLYRYRLSCRKSLNFYKTMTWVYSISDLSKTKDISSFQVIPSHDEVF